MKDKIKKIKTINWNRLKDFVKKNKKIIGLVVFVIGYVLFWVFYFGDGNVALEDSEIKNLPKQTQEKASLANEGVKKEIEKKKFTERDLGNFWLEINTEKIKIKAPIIDGIESSDLNKGLGRHVTTSLPGQQGNIVISGHRWKFGDNPSYKIFQDLDKLKNGDIILVHYDGKIFEYEVENSGVVIPDEKGAREILKKFDQPTLTLYTCTPKYTALRRLYYRAKLVREIK